MREITKDWIAFINGKSSFQDCHFYTLFMDYPTDDEIDLILQDFPKKEFLISRLKRWLRDKDANMSRGTKDEMKNLIINDFKEKELLIHEAKLFPNDLEFINVKYENYEIVKKLMFNDQITQSYEDFLIDNFQYKTKNRFDSFNQKIINEFWEALYGITSNYNVQFYLYQPLLKIDYTAEYLYEFILKGGIYAFTEEGISFSIKP